MNASARCSLKRMTSRRIDITNENIVNLSIAYFRNKEYQQMTTNPLKRQTPKPDRSVIEWLLDSDPTIRWQVMRDLIHAPADEVEAERAKIAPEGWGAQLL